MTTVTSLDGPAVAKQLIGDALARRVEAVDHELCEPGDEDTFFVADLGDVYRQHMRWKKNLPRVRPFYGMFLSFLFLASLDLGFEKVLRSYNGALGSLAARSLDVGLETLLCSCKQGSKDER